MQLRAEILDMLHLAGQALESSTAITDQAGRGFRSKANERSK
jgi:hypothetical protein